MYGQMKISSGQKIALVLYLLMVKEIMQSYTVVSHLPMPKVKVVPLPLYLSWPYLMYS